LFGLDSAWRDAVEQCALTTDLVLGLLWYRLITRSGPLDAQTAQALSALLARAAE
jgi:hypothetical protein